MQDPHITVFTLIFEHICVSALPPQFESPYQCLWFDFWGCILAATNMLHTVFIQIEAHWA